MLARVVKALMASVLVVGITSVAPMPSASAANPTTVSADASDRAALKTALQRSWARMDSTVRYKTCWMWRNQPRLAQSSLVATFKQYDVSSADVLAVARAFFNNAC